MQKYLSNPKLPFYALISVLVLTGLILSIHHHRSYQIPWFAGESLTSWSIEARVEFQAIGEPVSINLSRPSSQNGFKLIGESTASPGYGVSYLEAENQTQWTIRKATGSQTLFYRSDFLLTPQQASPTLIKPEITYRAWEEPYQTAVEQISSEVHKQSANPYSYAQQLFKKISKPEQNQNISLLLNQTPSKAKLAVELLNKANIAAEVIYAIELEDGRRRQDLFPLVRVWSETDSVLFNPTTGKKGLPNNSLLWQLSTGPVLEVIGGLNSQVSFSIIKRNESVAANLKQQSDQTQGLINFSIHSLPLEEQSIFKTILLLPVGALVVCILRVLVGLRTSGTFMPVLIAIAFIQTSLMTGLIGFLLVVFVGLLLRGYLSRLNLLLVSRISAVIISVIAIIAIFSVISYQVGLTEGLKVTFFPMIILSWTIERMSILWEEEGPKEVLIQGGGSLLTAVIAYLAMTNDWIRHLTFNFIGIQFIIFAAILAIGNYTGYRLLELERFKSFVK